MKICTQPQFNDGQNRDQTELYEEMSHMREHVMKEIDRNGDIIASLVMLFSLFLLELLRGSWSFTITKNSYLKVLFNGDCSSREFCHQKLCRFVAATSHGCLVLFNCGMVAVHDNVTLSPSLL